METERTGYPSESRRRRQAGVTGPGSSYLWGVRPRAAASWAIAWSFDACWLSGPDAFARWERIGGRWECVAWRLGEPDDDWNDGDREGAAFWGGLAVRYAYAPAADEVRTRERTRTPAVGGNQKTRSCGD